VSKVQPAGIKQLASSTVISTMRSSPTVARMPDKVCAPWLAEYLHEMSVFPNGKNYAQDDFDRSFPRLVQAANTGLGHLRIVPKRGRKTETAGAGLRRR
jgi:phage terminase large subunit-like protein